MPLLPVATKPSEGARETENDSEIERQETKKEMEKRRRKRKRKRHSVVSTMKLSNF